MSKFKKSVRNCQHHILWRNHQNINFSYCYFLLKYEPRINDSELLDKEQNRHRIFFYIYFCLKLFHKFLTKGNSSEDQAMYVEEINIKCKKVPETQDVLRNATRKKLLSHPFSPAPNSVWLEVTASTVFSAILKYHVIF